ncbi:DUF6624 domain-containing protein [Mucilaginibacter sp. KACC 22063]|uniref:DUF6624 domain-containing protein n=1 Tax=Mucilaginibacter sp. KACC 22063 TaxID=3025666 RepID=UPI002366BF69|nr:DUF6624 domain-containing protein [Mucilaginibacter sp. KACC 22063]WDF55867.1 hypothetical protein PQ461_02175 [Mucilaginibacter sp. KACC 22063]
MNIKLKAIRDIDQNSRKEFIKIYAENNPEKTKALALQMKKTDKENQQFVAGLLDSCGWPNGLSAANNHTIFLVIDHGEIDYANKYLPLVKQQAELGIVPKSDLATLQDRILLRNGQKQLYGTQTLTIGTIIKVWPVDEPAGLDERRKTMGLQPMDEYLQAVKKSYRSEVYWDKTLTVEEAQRTMIRKP